MSVFFKRSNSVIISTMKFNRRSLQTPKIFDPETKIRQRNLAASNLEMSKVTDYLKDEVAERLVDRLLVYLYRIYQAC